MVSKVVSAKNHFLTILTEEFTSLQAACARQRDLSSGVVPDWAVSHPLLLHKALAKTVTVQIWFSSASHLELRSVENAVLDSSYYPELDPNLPCSSCCVNLLVK